MIVFIESIINKYNHTYTSMKQQAPPFRNLTPLTIITYPLHLKNQFMTYNLYAQDPVKGVTQSIPFTFPCVREGCMTTCYFEAKGISANTISQPCNNCGNQSFKRIFLDVGFKNFLEQHQKYIILNQPLSVQINPKRKEFFFCCSGIKNNLLGQLSAFIGSKIYDQMGFALTPAINSHLLDFPKLNTQLEAVMTPVLKKRQYFLYSFCKYVPHPKEEKPQVQIFLFLFGQPEPIKARILLESNNDEICTVKEYTEHTMVGFLGDLNTLVFVVPKSGSTQYYVSNVGQHFSKEENILRVVNMRDWRDLQGRFNGSLVIDQKSSSIFVIGGYDHFRNDSLEFISCFIKCRWERDASDRMELKAQIQKSHKMFQGRIGAYNTGMFSTVFKNPYNENKIAFRNSTFMLYAFDRQYGEQLDKDIASGTQRMRKDFLNVGGGLKDSTIFATGRFSTKKPGIRYLKYDTTSNENPIINQSAKGQVNFSGNNYILIELPFFTTQAKKKFKNHCIVIGGHRDSLQRGSKDDPDFTNIHFVNTNNLEQTVTLTQKFTLSSLLPDMVDQFTAIMKDKKTGNHYLRSTYPLRMPIQLRGGDVVHYLVLQFGLTTGLFQIIPGKIEKKKNGNA